MADTVHIILDWWDGPIAGIADFEGHPHVFAKIFDDAVDDWTRFFRLRQLDADAFREVMSAPHAAGSIVDSWQLAPGTVLATANFYARDGGAFRDENRELKVLQVQWSPADRMPTPQEPPA